MRTLLSALLFVGMLQGCAAAPPPLTPEEESVLEAEGAAAKVAGNYVKLIELAMPRAREGDPEFEFTVGYTMFEWLHDPSPKQPPKHSAKDALAWIYKAARANVPQAAGFLSSAYRFGDFTLPKNAELEECWRKVEVGEHSATICLAAEAKPKQS